MSWRNAPAKAGFRISTRPARHGEKLTTLDGEQRTLTAMNVLVCDEKGPLSIAGVMGGAESEVTEGTHDVLLEGAAWNFINIRRTAKQHNLPSEASFRFSRGVHPAVAESGVRRGLQYMAMWSGGTVAPGLVDEYPLKPAGPTITFTPADVKRLLGIDLDARRSCVCSRACSSPAKLPNRPHEHGKSAKSRKAGTENASTESQNHSQPSTPSA